MLPILWEYPSLHSVEYFKIADADSRFVLEGTVLLLLEDQPTRITYRVECDSTWNTRHVAIQQEHAGQMKHLTITVDAQQNWYNANTPIPFATGYYDVDLAVSPSTNTLPIRRLDLHVGERRQIDAVWVRFPGLTLEPLHQRYTRLDALRYRYENPGSGFTAVLQVDDAGLIVDYGEIWRRAR